MVNREMTGDKALSYRGIFMFWFPLSVTWVMMAMEGPFVNAVIARMAEPKFNLAAMGVAFSLALVAEAPIIMIMSAATALASDGDSFVKIRRFTLALNVILTVLMMVWAIPAVFDVIAIKIIRLPENVARLANTGIAILIPWPAAIGYRRLCQGILIRSNMTRFVAYGTMIRLVCMFSTATLLFVYSDLNGVAVGSLALSTAVVMEAIASRIMAAGAIRRLLSGEAGKAPEKPLTYMAIFWFYLPLMLMALLALGVRPLVTLYVGQSRMAIESLAVLPVAHSLVFLFACFGLSFQEAGIALMGDGGRNYIKLRNFVIMLGAVTTGAICVLSFTPLSWLWFTRVAGLTDELAVMAIAPLMIMSVMPAMSTMMFFERSVLMTVRNTKPISWATAAEASVILVTLWIGISLMDAVGVMAASVAFLVGGAAECFYLLPPFLRAVRKWR